MYRTLFIPILFSLILGFAASSVHASIATIELSKAVHFHTPGGDVVLVKAGTYDLKASENWLQLTPQGKERHQAILLTAQSVTHEEALRSPQALSLGGEEDMHMLGLFFPNGSGLWAMGSYSGIRSRGVRFAGGDRRHKMAFLQRQIAALQQKNKAGNRQRHRLNRSKIKKEIAKVESSREEIRNERQLATSQFENANQKATQYLNILSSVLKTMKEMNEGTVRNLR